MLEETSISRYQDFRTFRRVRQRLSQMSPGTATKKIVVVDLKDARPYFWCSQNDHILHVAMHDFDRTMAVPLKQNADNLLETSHYGGVIMTFKVAK